MYNFNDILVSLTFIFIHFFLFAFNYKVVNKKAFHPAVLFSLLWFAIILLHFIFTLTILNEAPPLSFQTYVLILTGTCTFSLGSFLIQATEEKWQTKSSSEPFVKSKLEISLYLRIILVAVVLIGLPFYILAAYRIFIASQLDNFFTGVRTATAYYDEDIGPTKYFSSFSYVVFGFTIYAFLQKRNWINRIMLIVCGLGTFAYAVLSTGRTLFLVILAVYAGISYIYSSRFEIKKYVLMAVGFLAFFMLIGVFWGKGGDTDSSAKENLKASTEVTSTYLVLSLNALDYATTHHMDINYTGENTFRFFIKIGQQAKIFPQAKVKNLIKEFQFFPYPTNVYTVYIDYIEDFGNFFAWFMLGMFGMLHTWLHNRAIRTKSIRIALYYSFLLFPLFMSFFQDQYMSLFSTWLQVVFYIELILFTNKIFIAKKW